jgi:hypothetical protein
MLDPRFVFLGAAINLAGVVVYARDTLKGSTKPNRVTWTLWALVPLIAFAIQLSEGVGLVSVLTLAAGIGPLVVLAASLANPKAYWRLTHFDLACGAIALMAVMLWIFARNASAALVLTLVADFAAGLPTFIKTYRHPATESISAYATEVASVMLALATIQHWDFMTYAFPLYLLLSSAFLCFLIAFPRVRLKYVM